MNLEQAIVEQAGQGVAAGQPVLPAKLNELAGPVVDLVRRAEADQADVVRQALMIEYHGTLEQGGRVGARDLHRPLRMASARQEVAVAHQ